MATNNATNTSNPITVAQGGTGLATLTAHSVQVGNGTGNVTQVAVGGTGTLLVGAAAADPAFATSAAGDFTFTSSTAGSTRTLTTANTDNTNTASNAASVVSVGGSSGGDPYNQYVIGTARSFSWGPDNSDSAKLKINTGANATTTPSSGTNLWTMTTGGIRTIPLQPAFSATLSASTSNDKTGDGTNYTLICNTVNVDQGSNYNNATGVFTAPVTGVYAFNCGVQATNLGAGHTQGFVQLTVTGKNYLSGVFSWAAARSSANSVSQPLTLIVKMTAADTASLVLVVSNSTKTVGVVGGTDGNTYFSGALLY